MIKLDLMVLSVMLAAACSACTQAASPPAPPPIETTSAPTAVANCHTGPNLQDPFLAHVHVLQPNFSPTSHNQSPPIDNSAVLNQDVGADLTAAFNAAPPSFQRQLCKLDGIYIDPTGCSGNDPTTCNLSDTDIANHSWGYRKYTSTGSTGEYIAVSLALWKNDPKQPWSCPGSQKVCSPPFHIYKTRLIQALLPMLSKKAGDLPKHTKAIPNDNALTVLATLAHETGHVLWWDTFVVPGKPTTHNTTTFCKALYPQGNWQNSVVDIPTNRWIAFGQTRNILHADISTVQFYYDELNLPQAGAALHNKIYSSKNWASGLAAFSPDEDFVESFELYVLVSAKTPLTSSQIQINGAGGPYLDDIPASLTKSSILGQKLQCFGPLPQRIPSR